MATASQQPEVTLAVPHGARMTSDSLDQGRVHLILGLSPEFNTILEKLAPRYGADADKAKVLNMAVGLLNYLVESVNEGKRVEIISAEGEVETELTGF